MRQQRIKRQRARHLQREPEHPAPAEAEREIERQRIEDDTCWCCIPAPCMGGCGRLVPRTGSLVCSECTAQAEGGSWAS